MHSSPQTSVSSSLPGEPAPFERLDMGPEFSRENSGHKCTDLAGKEATRLQRPG